MRDGEHKGKKVEVVPNSAIRLNYGEGEDDHLTVSASHDSIQRFVEPQYNYLRYYDANTMQIIAVYLGHEVLADLMDMGIPASVIRERISEGEMEAYEHHLGKLAMAAAQTVLDAAPDQLALPPGDQIEAEVQKAHEYLDAELSWYLEEWEHGRDGTS